MPGEPNIRANFEAPKKIETQAGAPNERPELPLEKQEKFGEKKAETTGETEALLTAARAAAVPVKSVISEYEEREKKIENFLARGLEDIYFGLPQELQAEFRKAGEETAKKINKLLEKTKINIGKIVSLIRKWLSIIPGVNKYFLEQEAKIKADEIIKLRKKN
jgi:predicted phage-related endonuclease